MKACAASKGQTLTAVFNGIRHRAMIVEVENTGDSVYLELQSLEDEDLVRDSYFKPAEEVEWPRRGDGSTVIWGFNDPYGIMLNIPVKQLAIGDIIPDEDAGWDAESEKDFSNGHIVKSVRYLQHPKAKNIWYWEVKTVSARDGKCFRRLAPMADPHICGTNSKQYQYNEAIREKEEREGELKPVSSGTYRHIFTGEEVVFKIQGRKGRPRLNSRPEPESWEDWELIEGDPHPNDPDYN